MTIQAQAHGPSTANYSSEFKRIFDRLCGQHHRYKVFTDWLTVAAACAHQEPYHLGFLPRACGETNDAFAQVEQQYMAAIKGYNADQLTAFAQLFGITKLALHHEKTDFLGSIFMELELGNERAGQFFTPWHLSMLMAQMTLTDVEEIIKRQGFFTLSEPASGGGGMIIAVAAVLEEMGYDPGEVMLFEAQDISRDCFCMTYIQTSLTGLCGHVHHGNTLSRETWEARWTPIAKIFWWRTRSMLTSLYSLEAAEPTAPGGGNPLGAPAPMLALETTQPPTAPAQQLTLFDLQLPSRRNGAAGAHGAPTKAANPAAAEVITQAILF